ncbi:hypothetical protein NM208_g8961 [Fusarium decemcellulare]|uniref:Uncharacterized protein n=1 Tax=Fusarium decemcellulare TaxID=57161 RepID=A0ACC1S3D3_9HYPO|nr:hypothetical protein NM208_g8961 [Fusarium decemcellulare]
MVEWSGLILTAVISHYRPLVITSESMANQGARALCGLGVRAVINQFRSSTRFRRLTTEPRTEKPDRPPREVNVVVTGFSPWGPGTPWPLLPVNTSWEIANAMPRVIFRENKPNIRIIEYPDALWTGSKSLYRLYMDPDEPKSLVVYALLHIGMLDKPGEAFRIERNGYKCGYDLPDVDGKYPTHDDKTGGGTWDNVPEKISTGLDIDLIHKRVTLELKNVDIVISDDYPRFLCGYTYFSSLAYLYNKDDLGAGT